MKEHAGLVFSLTEYERRLLNTRKQMISRSVDYLILTEPDNICYLTGHQTSGYGTLQVIVVPLHETPFSYTRLLEEDNILTRTWIEETHTYTDSEDYTHKFIELLKSKNINNVVAIENEGFFLHETTRQALKVNFSKWVEAKGIVEKGRLIKSLEELELLSKVARITEIGMEAGLKAVGLGVSENTIAAEMHHAMYKAGGEYPSVPPYVSCGPRTIIGHATWEGRKIQNNECIFLELAGCLKRYHTAMMRLTFVGEPPDKFMMGFEHANQNLDTLMKEMKPGVTPHHIDTCTRNPEFLKSIGATQISRTGYSMGIAFAPSWDEGHLLSLKEGEMTPLEEGMVFHLIPWLQYPGLKMVTTLSETVVVTKNGAKSLFNFPRDML